MVMTAAQTALVPDDTKIAARALEIGYIKKPDVVQPQPTGTIKINCGGGAFGDWIADTLFGAGGGVNSTTKAIVGVGPSTPMYQSERWGMDSYNIPLASGVYTVTLYFAEINPDAGARVFSVYAEGKLWLSDYDISAQAGGAFKPTKATKVMLVTDGVLNLTFSASSGSAKVSGIEITPGGTLPVEPPPVTPPVTPSSSTGDTPVGKPASGAMTPVNLPILDISAPEIVNKERGLVKWLGNELAPQPEPALSVYDRDNVYWSKWEPSEGVYDWSFVDARLAEAKARNGTWGFRMPLMSMGDQRVPSYIINNKGRFGGVDDGANYVIDWNNLELQKRWGALWKAFSARYKDNPYLDLIDAGGYGKWGEGHMYEVPSYVPRISLASAKIMFDLQIDTMPNKLWFILPGDGAFAECAKYALGKKLDYGRTPGLRGDAGGTSGQWDNTANLVGAALAKSIYKTGPVFMELGNLTPQGTAAFNGEAADFKRVLQQVLDYHVSCVGNGNTQNGVYKDFPADQQQAWLLAGKKAGYRIEPRLVGLPSKVESSSYARFHVETVNSGVAPMYKPTIWIWNMVNISTNRKIWTRTSDSGLLLQQPGLLVAKEVIFNLPADLPTGDYQVTAALWDLDGGSGVSYKLATSEVRNPDGSYNVGRIKV